MSQRRGSRARPALARELSLVPCPPPPSSHPGGLRVTAGILRRRLFRGKSHSVIRRNPVTPSAPAPSPPRGCQCVFRCGHLLPADRPLPRSALGRTASRRAPEASSRVLSTCSIAKKTREEGKYFQAIDKKEIGGFGKSPSVRRRCPPCCFRWNLARSVHLAGPPLPLWPGSLGGVRLIPGSGRSCPPPRKKPPQPPRGSSCLWVPQKAHGPRPAVNSKRIVNSED